MHLTKSGGLRSWKALDFKKWGRLEPRSLTEVYAYEWEYWLTAEADQPTNKYEMREVV